MSNKFVDLQVIGININYSDFGLFGYAVRGIGYEMRVVSIIVCFLVVRQLLEGIWFVGINIQYEIIIFLNIINQGIK